MSEKRIPRTKIEEGIAKSLEKSTEHLDAAEVLINHSFLDDAVALIEFAIEEFGRAVYLRERLQKGSETIEELLETDHWLKYNKAFSVLPTELKTIWEKTFGGLFAKGYWPTGFWPKGFWGESIKKETVSPKTRPNAIFTKFDEKTQTWHKGIRVDRKKLQDVVNALREHIRNF